MRNRKNKAAASLSAIAAGTMLFGSLSLDAAELNELFAYNDLGTAGKVRTELIAKNTDANTFRLGLDAKMMEGSCGEGKCGEGSCGEGEEGEEEEEVKSEEHKCGEGACGEEGEEHSEGEEEEEGEESEAKSEEQKCGENKCGEGACGAE